MEDDDAVTPINGEDPNAVKLEKHQPSVEVSEKEKEKMQSPRQG